MVEMLSIYNRAYIFILFFYSIFLVLFSKIEQSQFSFRKGNKIKEMSNNKEKVKDQWNR